MMPPRTAPAASSTTTLLLFALLLLSFFPSIFHLLWSVPMSLIFPSPPSSALGNNNDHDSSPAANSPASYASPPIADGTAPRSVSSTMWSQKQFTLPSRSRGSYLITDIVLNELPEIKTYKVGLLNLFVQHTSCALSLNENWDEDVRADMSDTLDRIVPEAGPKGEPLYRHDAEGPDDLPAHVKSALIGASVTIPIKDGKLCTGTWQGIWYLEFRAARHSRRVVATIQGEQAS